jgi:type III secretory pathway component EscR
MANSSAGTLSALVNLAVWLTGVLVSLAVGFGMVDGVLGVRWIPVSVTMVAGWFVVVLTLMSLILAIIDRE